MRIKKIIIKNLWQRINMKLQVQIEDINRSGRSQVFYKTCSEKCHKNQWKTPLPKFSNKIQAYSFVGQVFSCDFCEIF